MAKQTVSTKKSNIYGYISREKLRELVERLDFGVENALGKKETMIKVVNNAKQFNTTVKDVVTCTIGNTDGYVINQQGMYKHIINNTEYEINTEGINEYIPVIVAYAD